MEIIDGGSHDLSAIDTPYQFFKFFFPFKQEGRLDCFDTRLPLDLLLYTIYRHEKDA